MLTFSVDYKKRGVYQITNEETGMFYIGSSINIQSRLTEHFCRLRNNGHSNSHLQNAYNKYGECSFSAIVLEEISMENLRDREQFWLDKTEAFHRDIGYNISPSVSNQEVSEETRQKIGKQSSGRIVTSEENRKRSESLKRHWQDNTPPWTGRKHTLEAIAKMRVAQKGRVITEEARRKISEAHTGMILSPEHKRKIRLSVLKTKNRQKIDREKDAGQLFFDV